MTNVYFLMVAGSVATGIVDVIDDPESIMATLGTALPAISVLFINYTVNAVLIQIPADMLRLYPLILLEVYRYVFNEKALTRRQVVEGPLEEEPRNYGVNLPKLLYLMVLTVTYWTIAPILTAVLTVAFAFTFLTWKYKMMYVYVARYEAGGLFWYGLYKYTMYALVASNVSMIIYLSIKEGPIQAGLLIPLLYVVFKAWRYTEYCFKDSSMYVAYSNAVEADCSEYGTPESKEKLLSSFQSDYYKQPYYSAPQIARLQPYRIDGLPLWTTSGNLAPEYYLEVKYEDLINESISDTSEPSVTFQESNSINVESKSMYCPPAHISSFSVTNPIAQLSEGDSSNLARRDNK